MTHCFSCQGKFPPALSPAGLADALLLSQSCFINTEHFFARHGGLKEAKGVDLWDVFFLEL